MGNSTYSRASYDSRTVARADTARSRGISIDSATFDYDYKIKTGEATRQVHELMSPYGVKIRESRDSAQHPLTLPVIVVKDVTGSMKRVPVIIQSKLSELMALLTNEGGKQNYLGEYYPAIMISAVDDFYAVPEGTFQVGQFESGIEIDNDLSRLWLTGGGGGTYEESYELAMYFAARHTAHDNWDKRGRKGYMFIIGDEHAYPKVFKKAVKQIFGEDIAQDIPLADIVAEVRERYHVFFVVPNMTSHYDDASLYQYWMKLLSQQRVLKLDDPKKVCELIATSIAVTEEYIGVGDVEDTALREALRPIELE